MLEQEIINFLSNKKRIIWKSLPKNYKEYLSNKYNDSESFSETYYRILNHIDVRPLCKQCGKKVNFIRFNLGFSNFCSHSCALKNKEVQEKLKNTCLKKYGVDCVFKRKDVIEHAHSPEAILKQKETSIKNWGAPHPMQSEKYKEQYIKKLQKMYGENITNVFQLEKVKEKSKKTWINNYGVEHPMKSEIVKEKLVNTFLEKFNVKNPYNQPHIIEKSHSIEAKIKCHESKKKNKSYGISKLEMDMFNKIKEKYPDVIFQYKDNIRYPWSCDFYIPSIDTFIECQGTWQHGKHPYNPNNIEDINLINEWKSRIKLEDSKKDQYYNALQIFTVSDVNKRNTAKNNNLNYLEFWNMNDLNIWLDSRINS